MEYSEIREYSSGMVKALRERRLARPTEEQCVLCARQGRGWKQHLEKHIRNGELVPILLWRSLVHGEWEDVEQVARFWAGLPRWGEVDWKRVQGTLESWLMQRVSLGRERKKVA